MAALLVALILLFAMAPPGSASAIMRYEQLELDARSDRPFSIGATSSEMINGGGRVVATHDRSYFINEHGQLICEEEILAEGNLSCLNVLGNTAYYVRRDDMATRIMALSLLDLSETTIASLAETSVRELYVVNGADFYILCDKGIELYSSKEQKWSKLVSRENIWSFTPTSQGIVFATGRLFHYDLQTNNQIVATDVDGYYVDEELNGGSLVFTKAGSTYQVTLRSVFHGDCVILDYIGYETVSSQELLSNLNDPDSDFEPLSPHTRNHSPAATVYRKTLSNGVSNIVKRAYQMTNILWTPQKNITGWNGELTYQAGTTYTGLPYGQPVTTSGHVGSYVPWQTDLMGFVSAVNDLNSKMYTSQATYNSVAPYFSCDCSAFVSWAWNLPSRQTTTYIPSYATLVSGSSYTGLQVGDCFCKKGSHVVLVTDITYNESGAITGVEISESTVNAATNYCCQKTWYGDGYGYPLSSLQTKYIDSGYGLYRSKTRDSAGYAHCCAVPLEGDTCELCGLTPYTSRPTYATIRFTEDATIYLSPDENAEHWGTAFEGGTLNITASTSVDGTVWYLLETSGWVKASQAVFQGYIKTVKITDEYLPSGRLVAGNIFPLEGVISAENPIISITAEIKNSDGTAEQSKTVNLSNVTSYSLRSSQIDNSMVFNTLAEGEHTLTLYITETASCDGEDSESLITELQYPFTIYRDSDERIVTARGIDVSKYQGDIDWDTAKDYIDFAILRCGYGDDLSDQDDGKWARNADACTRLGIPFGVYIYSYALTDEQALSEAQHVIRLLEGYQPSLPVYLDLEDSGTTGTLSCAAILRHTRIFCEAIEAAGYSPGVYANTTWWSQKLGSGDYNQWNRWVARFSDTLNYYGELSVWQYSESGTVPGISGNVDMNYWYGEFPNSPNYHDHNYVSEVTTPASCTESGQRTFTCTICGDQYTEELAPLGHAYGQWVVILAPSCTETGVSRKVCDRCGDIQEQVLPALGHQFSNGVCIICGIPEHEIRKGDINGDGDITSADAVMLARFLVDLITLSDAQIVAADLNSDGYITSADAVIMAKTLTN